MLTGKDSSVEAEALLKGQESLCLILGGKGLPGEGEVNVIPSTLEMLKCELLEAQLLSGEMAE